MLNKIDLPADGTVKPLPEKKAKKAIAKKAIVHNANLAKLDTFQKGVKSLGVNDFTVSLYRGEIRIKADNIASVPDGFTKGEGFISYRF